MAGDETTLQSQTERNQSNDGQKKKEELENQIRKRVGSEERAFRIVESLVDVTVSIERLKEMVHFLLPAHYKDITEERAIVKLCGFPVCKKNLGNVTKQKYQISTKTNKVYDITEKKNFCSSKCYKLSKMFEKQILESPLWSRETEKPADFLLPETKTGWLGVEVIGQEVLPEDSVDADDAAEDNDVKKKTEASSILDCRSWIDELQENLVAEKPLVFNLEKENLTAEKADTPEADPLDAHEEDENQGFNLLDVSDCLKDLISDDDAISDVTVSDVTERLSTVFDSDDDPDPDSTDVTVVPSPHCKKRSSRSQVDNLADGLSKINLSEDEKLKKGCASKADYFRELLNAQKKSLCVFIDDVPSGPGVVEPPHPAQDESKNTTSQSNPVSAKNLPIPESAPSASSSSVTQNPPASNRQKIKNNLHSWVTQDSLRYLGIATEEVGDAVEDSKTAIGNPDFAKLCDRLDMRGMEFDELLEERLPQAVQPPQGSLPSYKDLQKETANFSVKVKEYYKPPPKKKEEKTDDSAPVYIVPPVDSHSQIHLRRSIVLQQLGKRINALLSPMNVLLGEISTEMNQLVSTFNLRSDTIAFKPAEWSVIGIFLIFMLSKKMERLDVALQIPKVQDRFTGILNKFGLNFQDAQQILENEILLF